MQSTNIVAAGQDNHIILSAALNKKLSNTKIHSPAIVKTEKKTSRFSELWIAE